MNPNEESIRLTIMIDKSTHKKLLDKQANRIKTESRSVSFSEVVTDAIEKGVERI